MRDFSSGGLRIYLDLEVRRVHCRSCGLVKQEKLFFLADNPFYTKRFAIYVGRRCRSSSIKDIAKELHLHWDTVKDLDKQYMKEQLRRIGTPAPQVIGVDEVSIRKGHSYRIVVSDLLRKRPIWFGSVDRSEESMDMFFKEWGSKKTRKIRLAVMDMWKPFRKSTLKNVPKAANLIGSPVQSFQGHVGISLVQIPLEQDGIPFHGGGEIPDLVENERQGVTHPRMDVPRSRRSGSGRPGNAVPRASPSPAHR